MAKGGSIWASLGLNTKNFEKGLDQAKIKAGSFGKDIVSMTAGSIAGAFAVESLVSFGKEAFNLSGKFKGVEASFERLNDPSLLDNLRAATKGTVSDLELMQKAVMAKNLGLPISQLGTYFEFARRRAKETGESVDYLVDSIVRGIGRKSPLILDNLGISASALNAELKNTADFGAAAGNIINRELTLMGEDVDTATEKTARLAAMWENFKVVIGDSIVRDLDPYLTTFDNLLNGNENLLKIANDYSASLGLMDLKIKSTDESINSVTNEYKKLSLEQLKSEKGVKSFVTAMISLGLTTDEIKNKFQTLAKTKLIQAIDSAPLIRTITVIDEEIKKSQESLNESSTRSEAARIQTRIKQLESEKNRILGIKSKEYEELAKLKKAKSGLDMSVSAVSSKGLTLKEDELPTFPIQQGIDALPTHFDLAMAAMEKRAAVMQTAMKSTADAINGAFANLAGESLATFGEGLGAAFNGSDGFEIGTAFAQIISDSIGMLGKQLIQTGIIMTGIMETLKTAGWANPALLIGGGIALVALSSAMKGMMTKPVAFAQGGLVTGATMGLVGEGIGTSSSNPEVIAPLDKLKGFLQPQGGGGQVDFRIQGNTLVGILNRQSKSSKFSR